MSMDVRYINPFVEAVQLVLKTVAGVTPHRSGLGIARTVVNPKTLVALIGLSHPIRGTVALHLPASTALAIMNHWLEMSLTDIDDTVVDGLAEMVNMIAGHAKAMLAEQTGLGPISLGLPSVVAGGDFNVRYPANTVWLELPFESDIGPFSLRVTLEISHVPEAVPA